jgi:hypothetical protein
VATRVAIVERGQQSGTERSNEEDGQLQSVSGDLKRVEKLSLDMDKERDFTNTNSVSETNERKGKKTWEKSGNCSTAELPQGSGYFLGETGTASDDSEPIEGFKDARAVDCRGSETAAT